MRLFIALPLSEKITDYIKDLQDKLPDAKMTLNRHFHLTLQFLGDADINQAQAVMKELKKITFNKFPIKLTRPGVFKDKRGYIRIVWLGMEYPEELKILQTDVEDLMKPLGFIPDKPFSPHLTLARVKFADDKIFEEKLNKIKTEIIQETIDRMVLFESVLSPEGASYNELLTIKAHD